MAEGSSNGGYRVVLGSRIYTLQAMKVAAFLRFSVVHSLTQLKCESKLSQGTANQSQLPFLSTHANCCIASRDRLEASLNWDRSSPTLIGSVSTALVFYSLLYQSKAGEAHHLLSIKTNLVFCLDKVIEFLKRYSQWMIRSQWVLLETWSLPTRLQKHLQMQMLEGI